MSRLRQALVTQAARVFFAGPSLDHAIARCRSAARAGLASTIGLWSDPDATPAACSEAGVAAAGRLSTAELDCYLSSKGPPLGCSAELLRPVVERATTAGVRVHVDAMAREDADATFAMLDAVRPLAPRLGCTLPGRWVRSLHDVEHAIEQRLDVRVVKGQWPDPDAPDRDERGGFLEVVERLAGRGRHVAVATHDAPLAAAALRLLQRAGTPCELEVLLGWPSRRTLAVARVLGVPARVYVPYGTPHLPYEPRATARRFLVDLARAPLARVLQPWKGVPDRALDGHPAGLHTAR